MSRTIPARGLSRLALLLLPLLLVRPLPAEDVNERIGNATDKGIDWLLKAIDAKQFEGNEDIARKRGGKIGLETYALLVAGVPVDHPLIKKNFETLAGMALDHTYSIACYIFALDAAMSQMQSDASMGNPSQKMSDDSIGAQFRPRLEAGVNALIRLHGKDGGWNYNSDKGRFDNSNTQFAVLGLGVGWKHKVPIPREVWIGVVDHFIRGQKKEGPDVAERPEFYPEDEKGEGKRERIVAVDKKTGEKVDLKKKPVKEGDKKSGGSPTVVPVRPSQDFGPEKQQYRSRGWDYESKGGETWNMTCSGLSSLILADMALKGQIETDLQNQINRAIRDGYAWIMSHWGVPGGGWSYYGIYSLEKVADLGEVKKFGGHDWFEEISQKILGDQQPDGGWPATEDGAQGARWNTAFALLVLNRATSLITSRSIKNKFVGTGGARRDANSDDRNWVYLKDYDREFHIPTVLRQLRQRPTNKLLKMLEMCLREYDPEKSGFLVANLARTREEARRREVKDFLTKQLKAITGVEDYTLDQYLAWANRWVDVHKIGTDGRDPGGKLVTFYARTSKSLPLRRKIIWAVGRCRSAACAPSLIEDLANADPDIRQLAYETLGLLKLSRDPVPFFDAKGSDAVRAQHLADVRAWADKAGVKAGGIAVGASGAAGGAAPAAPGAPSDAKK